MFLEKILSKRERELIERDTYNRELYTVDYQDEWFYGNDLVDEIFAEGKLIGSTYGLEDFREDNLED